jgi:hypothetical protein
LCLADREGGGDRVTEQWRPIPGYEGLYQISDLGRVMSLGRVMTRTDGRQHTRQRKFMRPQPNSNGRLQVKLTARNGSKRLYQVHRLAMAAFVGPCPEGMEVLHWDDDATNNRLSNLRYGTRLQNWMDRRRNRLAVTA